MALNQGIWDPKLRGTNIKGTNLKSLNCRRVSRTRSPKSSLPGQADVRREASCWPFQSRAKMVAREA